MQLGQTAAGRYLQVIYVPDEAEFGMVRQDACDSRSKQRSLAGAASSGDVYSRSPGRLAGDESDWAPVFERTKIGGL
ncbi:MAG: hypothetical protein ACYC3X_27235 [Pirellulaceae bacterium]